LVEPPHRPTGVSTDFDDHAWGHFAGILDDEYQQFVDIEPRIAGAKFQSQWRLAQCSADEAEA
jgi:hypothetical protein